MEAIDAARGALNVTSGLFPYQCVEEGVPHAVLALSGVARCRRLLEGMVLLHESSPDLVGGFARAHYEAWLWTMYLLLDGDEARRRLDANDVFEARRRAKDVIEVFSSTGAGTDDVVAGAQKILDDNDESKAAERLSVLDAAKKVTTLLAVRDERVPDYPRRMYAVLYRGESLLSVHWGLPLANTHITKGEGGRALVLEEPIERGISARRLELTASGLLSVAGETARQLGLPDQAIMDLGRRWFQSTDFPTQPSASS